MAKGKSYLQIGLFCQWFYSNIILWSIYFRSLNTQSCEHTEDSFTFRYKSHSSFELILCWSGFDSDALSLLDSISVSLPERKTQDKVFIYIYMFLNQTKAQNFQKQISAKLLFVCRLFCCHFWPGWGGAGAVGEECQFTPSPLQLPGEVGGKCQFASFPLQLPVYLTNIH